MPQNPDNVWKELQEKRFKPVYFLQGEEPFYLDKISDFIEENALSIAEKGFNQVIGYGREMPVGSIINQARRFPMMAERTVVVVREAQEIPDLNTKESQELLAKYAAQPLSSTVLVLVHKHKSLDGRKELTKVLEKTGALVESRKIYDNKLPEWVLSYGRETGLQIQPAAAQMMADAIGNDLSRIAKELDKLRLHLPDKKTVTAALVEEFVGISREYNSFELQKALIQRDILKANRIVNYFELHTKQHPVIPVIGLLFGFFAKVMLVHQLPDKSEGGIAKALGINPYFAKDYLQAMRNFPLTILPSVIHALREADLQSKGIDSVRTDGEILRELVFKILH
jgi:DNA polymerase III subunit delta